MVDLHDSLRPAETVSPLPVSEIARRARRRQRRRRSSTTGLAAIALCGAALTLGGLPSSLAGTDVIADGAQGGSSDTPPNEPTPDLDPDRDAGPDPSVPAAPDQAERPHDAETTSAPNSLSEGTTAEAATSSVPPSGSTPTSPPPTNPTATDLVETAPAGSGPTTSQGISTSTSITSQWDEGYCFTVEVTNDTEVQIAWQVVLDLQGAIATVWNARVVEASSGTFVFIGDEEFNVVIQPDATTSFGTCVDSVTP